MGCCQDLVSGFAKYILFLFNLLILIAAAILIAMAVKFRDNNHGFDLNTATIFPIVLGVFIALVAFFGCCGAVRESSCMLSTYATILMILFVVQLVLGIMAFIAIKKNGENKDEMVHKYLEKVYEQSSHGSKEYMDVVDGLQKSLHCCGLNGRTDSYVKNGTTGLLIRSCCRDTVKPCTIDFAYDVNCTEALSDNLGSILKAIGAVAIVFGVIELVASIFACYVKNTANN